MAVIGGCGAFPELNSWLKTKLFSLFYINKWMSEKWQSSDKVTATLFAPLTIMRRLNHRIEGL